MEKKIKKQNDEVLKGELLLGCAVLLFVGTLLLKNISVLQPYLSLIQGIALFLGVLGAWNLIQYTRFQKNPAALQKARVDSMDERKNWIQSRSGNNAFKFGITVTYLALLGAGATEGMISSDVAWWVLAGIVVGTLIVYIISVIRYEQIY